MTVKNCSAGEKENERKNVDYCQKFISFIYLKYLRNKRFSFFLRYYFLENIIFVSLWRFQRSSLLHKGQIFCHEAFFFWGLKIAISAWGPDLENMACGEAIRSAIHSILEPTFFYHPAWKISFVTCMCLSYEMTTFAICFSGDDTVATRKMTKISVSEAGHGQYGGHIEKYQSKKCFIFYELQHQKISIRKIEVESVIKTTL